MTKLTLAVLLDKAGIRHGHKCPSLYYGVTAAIAALDLTHERNIRVKQAVVHGISKCICDGAATVLEVEAQVTPLVVHEGCGLSLGDGEQNIQLKVRAKVRERINGLKEQHTLDEFQRRGLEYLQGLSSQDLFGVQVLEPKHFNRLLKEGR